MSIVLYDDLGQPNEMVRIPKFYISDVIEGGPHQIHPAFLINGKEQECIYISKYQNIVQNERGCSVEGKDPAVLLSPAEMDQLCRSKGKGWHLMTNAEWAAVALWSKKNGTIPHGNNDGGKDYGHPHEHGWLIALDAIVPEGEVGPPMRIATGSGPASWYHDGTKDGIADLNGNIWEVVSGIRIRDGFVEIVQNNDAAFFGFQDESVWKRLIIEEDTKESEGSCIYAIGGKENENGRKSLNYAAMKGNDENGFVREGGLVLGSFSQVQVPACIDLPGNLLQQLALAPPPRGEAEYFNDAAWGVLDGERYVIRGGYWVNKEKAGIFSYGFYMRPEDRYFDVGFRSCYYEDEGGRQ